MVSEDKPQLIGAAIVEKFASKSINNNTRIWLQFVSLRDNNVA
jgi:hypothetical protein